MRTIVVTGAARGIGRAIAEQLLDEGDRIIGTFHEGAEEAEQLASTYGSDRVITRQVDFADRAQTRDFIDHVRRQGRIDGLVLNAGVIEFALLPDTTEEQWDRVLEVNLNSCWMLSKGLADMLNPGSAVVAISSGDAFMASYASISYTVSKAGLNALMNCLAAVLGERGVRAIPLCAGWVNTGMATEESYEAAQITPLGRNAEAVDIARAVSFLLSSAAGFVNGSPFIVDGGYGVIDYIVKKEAEGLASKRVDT